MAFHQAYQVCTYRGGAPSGHGEDGSRGRFICGGRQVDRLGRRNAQVQRSSQLKLFKGQILEPFILCYIIRILLHMWKFQEEGTYEN